MKMAKEQRLKEQAEYDQATKQEREDKLQK